MPYYPPPQSAGLNTAIGTLTAGNVAVNVANSFFTGASVALGPGTWIIMAHITFTDGGVGNWTPRIHNTTDNLPIAEGMQQSGQDATVALVGRVVIASGTKTIAIQVASTDATGSIVRAATNNTSGNDATQIVAIQTA